MTNKTIIFGSAIAIALVAGIVSSGMLAEAAPPPKPPQDVFVTNEAITVTGVASSPVCPQENVQHWTALTFQPGASIEHPTKPSLGGEVEIKVDTTNEPVLSEAIGAQLAVQILNEEGYQTRDPGPIFRDVETGDINFNAISGGERITTYSTICAGP